MQKSTWIRAFANYSLVMQMHAHTMTNGGQF